MTKVDDGNRDALLTDDQTEMVLRFLIACPEMQDDQVRAWSARYPHFAEEFEITAELVNERREDIEAQRAALSDDEAGRLFRTGVERLFSESQGRMRVAMLH